MLFFLKNDSNKMLVLFMDYAKKLVTSWTSKYHIKCVSASKMHTTYDISAILCTKNMRKQNDLFESTDLRGLADLYCFRKYRGAESSFANRY